MNGQEYQRLFDMAQEGRDAALSCVRVLEEHGGRLDRLERTVNTNTRDMAVGRFGVRAVAWSGSLLIGLGGLAFGLWERISGNGPN